MATAYGAESTTDEVLEGVDLSGKRILVTVNFLGTRRRNGTRARHTWRQRGRNGARHGEGSLRGRNAESWVGSANRFYPQG